ncbi:MAG: hypothetical protein Q7R52_02645 [archaeon]|nr:hypothetical protein [archaeon]
MKNIGKFVKKITSIGVGISLIGATMLGAMAVDPSNNSLGNYKDVFSDGATIVVGNDASAEDVIGAVDIGSSLQSYGMTKRANAKPAKNDKKIYISEPGDLLEFGESLGEVKETLTDLDLAGLQSGVIRTDEGTTEYNQYLDFEDSTGKVVYSEDDDDKVSDFLFFEDGGLAFEYKLEFEDGLESEVGEEGNLEDLEDKEISILGKTYSFAEAKEEDGKIDMTLFAGKVTDTLEEGETRTYTVNGKNIEVSAMIIADESETVKLKVNGAVSDKLSEGETDIVSDYVIGIRSVIPNEGNEASGGDIVEFYIGVDELEFSDDYTDEDFSSDVEINDESVNDASIQITANKVGDNVIISGISYRVNVDGKDGDVYVKSGSGLRSYLRESEAMIHDGWDVVYEGMDNVETSVVKLDPKGDDKYELVFENNQGVEYKVDLFDNSDGFKYGEDEEGFHFVEPDFDNLGFYEADTFIAQDDVFVLTDESDEDGVTNILRYENIDAEDNRVTFTDLGSGDSLEVTYTGEEGDTASGSLIRGGDSYTFKVSSEEDGYRLAVDLDHDKEINGDQADIVVRGGGILKLDSNIADDVATLELVTLEKQFDNADEDEVVTFEVTPSDDELDVDVTDGVELNELDGNSDTEEGMTDYGVLVSKEDNDNDPDSLEFSYPKTQRGGKVAITVGEQNGEVEVQPLVVSSRLASEVDGNEKRLILVGGPCANPITAAWLGVSTEEGVCSEGFQPGEAVIKLVRDGDRVAMIVAGWESEDTRAAVQSITGGFLDGVNASEVLVTRVGNSVEVLEPRP